MRAWSTSVLRRAVVAVVQLSLAVAALAGTQGSTLPNAAGSLKFAVIGDNGTGSREQ